MARALVDLATLDLTREVMSQEELRKLVPHREHFQMVDGIAHLDLEQHLIVGYKDWGADAWWAPGHVPGKPLMPGVLMIEGAAQVTTVLIRKQTTWEIDRFIGLGGLNDVRFRGQLVPPARIWFVAGRGQISGRRLARFPAQAFANGQMLMEMELLGVLL
jgi:3-hydroxyacyl-[acyl-carrier-protein] dehydratase